MFENTEAEGAESVGNQGSLVLDNFCYLSLSGTSQTSLACWKCETKTKACQQVKGEQRSPLSVTYVHVEYDRHADFIERATCVEVTGLSIIYSMTYWRKGTHNLKELKLELLGT